MRATRLLIRRRLLRSVSPLTDKDLEGISKVIDAAASKDVTAGLNELPEAKGLSPRALAFLDSLTEDELEAFHSVFLKLKKHGGTRKKRGRWIL
jgi:hypothetical protein